MKYQKEIESGGTIFCKDEIKSATIKARGSETEFSTDALKLMKDKNSIINSLKNSDHFD